MDRKTHRRIGALRRLLNQERRVDDSMWYARHPHEKDDELLWIRNQMRILRERIPVDVLEREGLR